VSFISYIPNILLLYKTYLKGCINLLSVIEERILGQRWVKRVIDPVCFTFCLECHSNSGIQDFQCKWKGW
jgi:hypothetical protein